MPVLHRITTFNGGNSSSNMLNKVQILQSVNRPCITNLEDVIDTPNCLFILLELAEGGYFWYILFVFKYLFAPLMVIFINCVYS